MTTDPTTYGSISGDFDAFETKDRVFGAGVMRDPYPRLAELQSGCPVHRGSLSGQFGMTGADTMLFPEEEQWSVFSFLGTEQVLRDTTSFSSSWYQPSIGGVIGRTILEMDPPDHHRFRMLIQGAFTKKEMDRWERDFVLEIVDGYIDRFAGAGRADLVADFAFHYPINVIAVAAGLPTDDIPTFYRHTALLTNIAVSEEQRRVASVELGELVQRLIDERRATPSDDLVGVLVRAEFREDPDPTHQRLTDEEIIAFMRLLVPAGAQTTYRAISTVLYGLLTHPDQLEAVRSDPSLIPQAIEEGLRWEVPLISIGRSIVQDTEVEGVDLPAGCQVNVSVAAANHDAARWDRPHEFDIFREPLAHLGFGGGPHICLGIHFARMEMRVALERLLERLPNLRLDPDADDVHITGLGMRTANRLPVLFDAEA